MAGAGRARPAVRAATFSLMNLGRLYAAKGMLQQAISEFERALEIQPGEPTCEAILARLCAPADAQLNERARAAWSGETREGDR